VQLNNDVGNFSDNTQLNQVAWDNQTVRLEEGLARIQQGFQAANDAVRGQLLMDINRYEMSLAREEQSTSQIQDPQDVRGNRRGRTFGQGGRRLPTGGEIAEKELQQYDQVLSQTRSIESSQTLVHLRQRQPSYDHLASVVKLTKRPSDEITVLSIEPRYDILPSPNASRPMRRMKRPSIYQGELLQPRKRIRKK